MTGTVPDLMAHLRAAGVTEVLAPTDPGFERRRRVWNSAVDRRPATIARCHDVTEVVAAVGVAREHGQPTTVRGGGHGIAGQAVADGALMLDLSPMRGIEVDHRRGVVAVAPGVTWAELDRATTAYGTAVTGADVSSVSVIGTALVGGCGWLQRRDGLSCDRVRALEIVTAGGAVREVGPDRDPELWWALRGAGAGLGVVTRAELEPAPVGVVHAGTVVFPASAATRVLRGYREVCAQAPDELSLQATLLPWPPGAPDGAPKTAVSVAWFGPPERADEAVAPIRRLAAAELDLVRRVPYVDLQAYSDQAFPAGWGTATGTEWLRDLDDTTIDALVAAAETMPTPMSMISLHQLGGAMSRVPPAATAFGARAAHQHLAVFSSWPSDGSPAKSRRWAAATVASVAASSAGGPYLALLDGGTAAERVHAGLAAGAPARLRALKERLDPDDLFAFGYALAPHRYAREH